MESPLYNVGGWLARRARIAGDRLAVVDADRSLSYLALDERTTRCAAALADAGMAWNEIEAVAAASSRFSGGKGWGLNGNDIVEDFGPTGVPVFNLSAGCAAGGNAFNIGYSLVAGGMYDRVLVVGGEKLPKGFIQTSGVEDIADLEYLRQLAVGMPGPALPCRGRRRHCTVFIERWQA